MILGYTSKSFSIKKEIFGYLNVAPAGLLNFFQFKKNMKKQIFWI